MPILRPQQPVSNGIARITIAGDTVFARYPEKNEAFRAVVKELDYHWDSYYWRRCITPQAGAISDRAAELCHRLLAAGFCVAPPSETIGELALSAGYTPECRRWVKALTAGKYKGWLLLHWRDGDFYMAAMRISGAYDSAEHAVVVPPDFYDEVEDFAALYGFQFTAAAQAIVAQAKAERTTALVVAVPPLPEDAIPDPDIRPVLAAPGHVEIPDALLDDPL